MRRRGIGSKSLNDYAEARATRSLAATESLRETEVAMPAPAREAPQRAQEPRAIIPVDAVNEIVVICAAITDAERGRKLLDTVASDSFHAPGHSEIWAALQEIKRRGLHYDPATLRLVSGGKADDAMVERYLEKRPAAPPNLSFHVDALQWDRVRIEAVRGPITSLIAALKNPTSEPERIKALARGVSGAFDGVSGSLRWMRDPQALVREQAAEIRSRRDGVGYYPFDLEGFDLFGPEDPENEGKRRVLWGAAPGKVTEIVGIPGSGKSTLAALLAVLQARQGRKVAFAAWEQGAGSTLEQCACIDLAVSQSAFYDGTASEEDVARVEARMGELSEFIRFIELPFGRTRGERTDNNRSIDLLHELIAESGCDVFIADLLRRAFHQLKPDDEEQALYRMQGIAQETKTHQIWLHQLNKKDLEDNKEKRPTRESIKGTGAWVEVPDLIIGVHRPGLFKQMKDDKICLDGLKQRKGIWPFTVEFEWNADIGMIARGRGVPYEHPGSYRAGYEDDEVTRAGDVSMFGKSKRRKS